MYFCEKCNKNILSVIFDPYQNFVSQISIKNSSSSNWDRNCFPCSMLRVHANFNDFKNMCSSQKLRSKNTVITLSAGPRILLQYSNFGRTHSNNTCETNVIPDVDCISPLATRFIESSCNGKQRCRIDLPLLRQNYLGRNCRINDPVYLDVQENFLNNISWYSQLKLTRGRQAATLVQQIT